MNKFNKGDKVVVKHQPELGVMKVDNPHLPTNVKRVVTKEPVGHYVVVSNDLKTNQGYHEENLEHSK